ncbi:NXPE family member 3-like [Hypanus sabinus]|uniref:NXPE family member 3-like n=1 Tax=Hypanus sabinus TaxID=79690 RepID=UPI0028C3C9B7|nr:NXPE family member 3-like [Hypanus sabinus]
MAEDGNKLIGTANPEEDIPVSCGMWQGIHRITGYKSTSCASDQDVSVAERLRVYHARFDVQNEVQARKTPLRQGSRDSVHLKQSVECAPAAKLPPLLLFLKKSKSDIHSLSQSDSQWSRYPPRKNYSIIQQYMEVLKPDWTHKLLQYGYQSHSFTPEERSEGAAVLKMIEWPKPSNSSVPFRKSSNPSLTHFVILNSGKNFYVGDQLQVMVRMYDFEGNPKQYGGDYLQARIHTPELKAGSAGTVIDHQNGTYHINFTLFWPGKVQVSVSLVHPSEGIQVLWRLREEQPFRVLLRSHFKYGAISETTICNAFLPQTKPLCNFTDLRTGEPWFCYKPEKLSCSSRVNYDRAGYAKLNVKGEDIKFFQSKVNLKKPLLPSTRDYVTVKPSPQAPAVPGKCVRGKPMISPSGFYYKNQWMSSSCKIRRFDTAVNTTDCLRGKKMYLIGDSTMLQWFTYLTRFLPGLKVFDLGSSGIAGPLLAVDKEHNIMVEFRVHGPPIQFYNIWSQLLRYTSNKIDEVRGGKDTVIAITLCVHFASYPIEVYIRRLQYIRRSILLLLGRSPDTVVVIKTANVRALTPSFSLRQSDWFSYQLDLVLRRIFAGMNVAFVDAWEMTIAHYLPHNIHPHQLIIKNEMDVFLSFVCPSEKG